MTIILVSTSVKAVKRHQNLFGVATRGAKKADPVYLVHSENGASNKLKGKGGVAPLVSEDREKESPSPLFLVDKKESGGTTWTLSKRQGSSIQVKGESVSKCLGGLHGDLATCQ